MVYFQKKLNNAGILERKFFLVVSSKLEFILENHLFTADFATLSAKFQII